MPEYFVLVGNRNVEALDQLDGTRLERGERRRVASLLACKSTRTLLKHSGPADIIATYKLSRLQEAVDARRPGEIDTGSVPSDTFYGVGARAAHHFAYMAGLIGGCGEPVTSPDKIKHGRFKLIKM